MTSKRASRRRAGAPTAAPATAAAIALAVALAGCGDKPTEPVVKPPPVDSTLVEARALWVSRYEYSTAAQVRAFIDSAAVAGFNVIYFQVRGQGDAFYPPGLEPWTSFLNTGSRLGVDPGWDPLQTALDAARARGVQLHAWINSFNGWNNASVPPAETTPRHSLLTNPEWYMKTANGTPMVLDNGRWMTAAAEGARVRLARVAADIVRRYAVDGIHLDYIRYPQASPVDSLSDALWRAARVAEPTLSVNDFRRRAVTDAVRQVRDSVARARPAARLSAAVWGIYRQVPGWTAYSTGMDDRMQDSWGWAAQGLLDVIVPMVYWPIAVTYGTRTDFAFLADEHARNVSNRHVYIGISLSHMISGSAFNTAELIAEIERARRAGAEGVSLFSASALQTHRLWSVLRNGPFRHKATLPAMSWR